VFMRLYACIFQDGVINQFAKVSNIKFDKTLASIARKVSFVYSLSKQGGYHAAR